MITPIQGAYRTHMNKYLWILLVACTVVAQAEDIVTTSGVIYSNVTVKRAEPDNLVLLTSKGVLHIPFTELPQELGTKYGYDPAKAAEYQHVKAAARLQTAADTKRAMERAKAKNTAPAETDDAFPINAFDIRVGSAATTENTTTVSDGWTKTGTDRYWVQQPIVTTTKENKMKFTLKATISNRAEAAHEVVAWFGNASISEQLRPGQSKAITLVADEKTFLRIVCAGHEKAFPLP